MPTESSTTFITTMKLRELRTQRTRLRATYDRLAAEAAVAPDDTSRLRLLAEGLRGLTFAGQPLHPELAHLELLLPAIAAGQVAPATVAFWRERLLRELRAGQERAEAVYRFGVVLEEWARLRAHLPALHPQQAAMDIALSARVTQAAPSTGHLPLLDALLEPPTPEATRLVRSAVREILRAPVEPDEARLALEQSGQEPHREAGFREEAAAVPGSDLRCKEFADALTMLVEQLDSWDWPEEGLAAHARWSRTKWRLFIEDDLPGACLLEILGVRWQRIFARILGDLHEQRSIRLRRLAELGAPRVIIANERRLLEAARGLLTGAAAIDIWEDTASIAGDDELEVEQGSVAARRTTAFRELRSVRPAEGYGGDPYPGVMSRAAALINAEVALGRAAFPERPLTLIKVDLQDFYPSLAHPLLLDLLTRLGLPEAELAFFRRFLAIPLRQGERVVRIQRGLPNMRRLSDSLGELVLRLLERHVQRAARVLVVRVMDDICLIAADQQEAVRAWRAVEQFCTACGLSPNMAKCGTVVLGGERPAELPAGPFTWQLLELDSSGAWRVHMPALEKLLAQTRRRMERAQALLSKIELYNAQIAHLSTLTALDAPLGEGHRESLQAAFERAQQLLWEGGLSGAIAGELARRLPDSAADLPVSEAWVGWPLTAGGLGATLPHLVVQRYLVAAVRHNLPRPPAQRPPDWQQRDNGWAAFYAALLQELEPLEPEEQPVMETLVRDFIARGSELSSGRQQGLSSYWRWVLASYGPQILAHFGTFRFLVTTLVPLQLIVERHRGDTEASVLLLQGGDEEES